MFSILRHAITRGVDDRRACGSGMREDVIKSTNKFLKSTHSVDAVMSIPDVTNNDGRFVCCPLCGLGGSMVLGRALTDGRLVRKFKRKHGILTRGDSNERTKDHGGKQTQISHSGFPVA